MTEASVNFGTGVSNAWSNVATFIPKFIVFLIILIVGYFIAKALAKLVARVLTRLGFDRLAERGGIKTVLAHSKYDAAGILGQIVYYAIMLFVLDVAFGVFGANPISGFLHGVIAYLPLLLIAIVLIVIPGRPGRYRDRRGRRRRQHDNAGDCRRKGLHGRTCSPNVVPVSKRWASWQPRRPAARDAARGRLLALGAGLLATSALVVTARSRARSRAGRLAGRYAVALEQLCSEELDVCIGGIRALERVARNSPGHHPAVMAILAAFIQERS